MLDGSGGARRFDVVFAPTPRVSLSGFVALKDGLVLSLLDNVRGRVVEMRRVGGLRGKPGSWQRREVPTEGFVTVAIAPVAPMHAGNDYFATLSGFLVPPSLYKGTAGSDRRELLKAQPARFDARGLAVQQHEAISRDGTRIPYFVIGRDDLRLDGTNPTLLYGYGGFEISQLPRYSATFGAGWVERGGTWVVANIRGGGEFGPAWHQAALKEKRQNAFDDFIAVAEDLIARKVTAPAHLGIMGGSNGGLLVGVAMTQRPELFKAVVCGAPLLDMKRYSKLLAGASWMGEYGDPDVPAEWSYIGHYSPYQNVRPDVPYPRVLFTTSTRDDRVHPGHARKMAARMLEQGHALLYYENIEGGHAGAADIEQVARISAMEMTFLWRELR
jgi:prolyl oligopeptidase